MIQIPPVIVLPQPPAPTPAYRIERIGHDQMRLDARDVMLTRHEAFRLIGELERMASTL